MPEVHGRVMNVRGSSIKGGGDLLFERFFFFSGSVNKTSFSRTCVRNEPRITKNIFVLF